MLAKSLNIWRGVVCGLAFLALRGALLAACGSAELAVLSDCAFFGVGIETGTFMLLQKDTRALDVWPSFAGEPRQNSGAQRRE
ncbi:hypothetical protein [Roseovarius dicentrarchi]|uniref:hypothetical protein n=1 Tax=Roseovarius dicentrarchi TaxID=2250573 RepID=UPI0013966A4F|nr:hypothetical protein [Roseovarius dicentrarchi]